MSSPTHNYPAWHLEARSLFETQFRDHLENYIDGPLAPAVLDAVIPGRRVRPSLFYAFWKCSRGHYPSTVEALPAIALELFHSASIIVDDIADGELTRRDKAPLYRLYDVDTAILASHYLVAKGYEALLAHPYGVRLLTTWTNCYATAAGGQFTSLQRLGTFTLGEQQQRSLDKTVPFFGFIAKALNVCLAEDEKDLCRVMQQLGWCFQVSNDVVDLVCFSSLGRHDPQSEYTLSTSYLVPLLAQEGYVHPDEVCARITYDRYLEISNSAQQMIGSTTTFLPNLFQTVLQEIANAEISECRRQLAIEFVQQTTKPSFWIHPHD